VRLRPLASIRPSSNGKPKGTTGWDGSVTELGSQMRSYYGRPVIKEPVWQPEVPAYFFTGGLAGASSALAFFARMRGNDRLADRLSAVGLAADLVSPALLISDLGRPERFLNMLRVFKVTSPMSVGSWVLASSGAASTLGMAGTVAGMRRVRDAGEALSALLGLPLSTYTAVLISNTAVPVWHDARRELPAIFAAGSAATAGAAGAIAVAPGHAGPARRAAIAGALAELGLVEFMERRLGFVGEVYHHGQAGLFSKLAKGLTASGAAVLAAGGGRSRKAACAGGGLILAGVACTRWSIFKAGSQSAADPRYTVEPQRERVRRSGTSATS
jgi:formate-dependent nitrite reductase membrane component NrfD